MILVAIILHVLITDRAQVTQESGRSRATILLLRFQAQSNRSYDLFCSHVSPILHDVYCAFPLQSEGCRSDVGHILAPVCKASNTDHFPSEARTTKFELTGTNGIEANYPVV